VNVAIVDAGRNQVSRSVEVNAPAAELFAAVADPRRHHEVDGSGTVRGNIKCPAQMVPGAKFSTKMRMFGVPYRITSTVTAIRPDELIEWRHPVASLALGVHRPHANSHAGDRDIRLPRRRADQG
jgi:uncharacterized protein YndB with AHSA1/START domain